MNDERFDLNLYIYLTYLVFLVCVCVCVCGMTTNASSCTHSPTHTTTNNNLSVRMIDFWFCILYYSSSGLADGLFTILSMCSRRRQHVTTTTMSSSRNEQRINQDLLEDFRTGVVDLPPLALPLPLALRLGGVIVPADKSTSYPFSVNLLYVTFPI